MADIQPRTKRLRMKVKNSDRTTFRKGGLSNKRTPHLINLVLYSFRTNPKRLTLLMLRRAIRGSTLKKSTLETQISVLMIWICQKRKKWILNSKLPATRAKVRFIMIKNQYRSNQRICSVNSLSLLAQPTGKTFEASD